MTDIVPGFDAKIVKKCNKVQKYNLQQFLDMSAKERARYKKMLKIKNDTDLDPVLKKIFLEIHGKIDFNKSSLYNRLLSGGRAFKYAPPRSYNSPWHDVIDGNRSYEISMYSDSMDIHSFMHDNDVLINQSPWKVVEIISNQEALLTCDLWDKLGFVWRFKLEKFSCKDTVSFICIGAETGKDRVTTLDELKYVQRENVLNKYIGVKMALDVQYYEKEKAAGIKKYGTRFGAVIVDQQIEAGHARLKERREKGLPDYPTEKEIVKEAEQLVESYFKRGFSVDEAGNLYSLAWMLTRISPDKVSEDIYFPE